jgi:hypothetical protein
MLKAFCLLIILKGIKQLPDNILPNFQPDYTKKLLRKVPVHKKKFIIHQDIAPAHKSVLALRKFMDLPYESLQYPHYFPDLASSDVYLFPKLKLFFAGQHFSSNQEAIAAVEGYFADLTKNHCRDGIMALEHCWNKCISLK